MVFEKALERPLGAGGLFKARFWSLKRLLKDHLIAGGLFQNHFVTRKRLLKDHKINSMAYAIFFFLLFPPAASQRMDRGSIRARITD